MNDAATSRPPRWPINHFLLVRIGEVEDDGFMPDFTGHSDPRLSARGRQQAEAIARRLNAHEGPPILGLYASPLSAAQTTGYIIEMMLGMPDTETNGALATIMPETLPPGDTGLATLSMMAERAWAAVEELRVTHPPDASVILVSHELPIRALICRALGMSLEDAHKLELDPASVSVIEFRGPRILLQTLNDVCHVDDGEG